MKFIRWATFIFVVCLFSGAAHAQQIAGPPCATSGNVSFQVPNIGNTTNWGYCLNFDLTLLDQLLGGTAPLQLGSTTPSVVGHTNWLTSNTSLLTITNLTGGFPGQTVRLICGASDTFTQIVADANIEVVSSWSCASSPSLTLTLVNGKWIEQGRGGGGGGGSGSVTNVSAGNLSPLFTTSVSSPSFTPNITFAQLSVSGNTVFGNFSGSSAVPSFGSLTISMIPVIPLATGVSGTLPHGSLPTLLSGDIPNNAANTSGNAATATALAATPSNCGAGVAAIGILANGNATGCFTPPVTSVFGRTGAVVAATNDYSFSQISGTLGSGQFGPLTGDVTTSGYAATLAASGVTAGSCGDSTHSCSITVDAKGRVTAQSNNSISGGGAVTSVFGRTGAVAAQSGDYSYSQISGTPTLFYQTIDSNATAQTQRPIVNLIPGTNMTISCVDNSGATRTDCTFTASATSATAWSALTPSTNSTSGTFSSSGNTWDFGAATSFKLPVASGSTPTASGVAGFDSLNQKWVFGQNGSTVSFGLASSSACAANQFVNTPATAIASASCAQPSFANISGTVAASQLPNPSSSTLGGIESYAAVSHQWINAISTSGVPSSTQPSLADIATGTAGAVMTFPGADFIAGGVNLQSGTTYVIASGDENRLTVFTSATAVAVTLPQTTTTGFGNGAIFQVFARGSGAVTITPTTSTINGNATVVLNQGQGAWIESDGTNYSAWVSAAPSGSGTVTSVAQTFTGGLISVGGSPITSSGTLSLTVAGTSGGIPCFTSSSAWASSGALTANGVVYGGGAGVCPSATAASTTVTNALFATAGAPGFRNIGTSDTSVFWFATDSGAANAYVLSPSPVVTALTTGTQVSFTTTHANTGGSTLNVSGLGVKNITKFGTNALVSGDILSGVVYVVTYDGTEWQLDDPSSADGTVTSVAQTFTGGLISVTGSPITNSGTLALTVAGTSGGIPYFSSSSAWASSGALGSGQFVLGGGAGSAPTTSFSIVPAANGGSGTASPAAHTVALAEGSSAFAFSAPSANGQCFMSAAASFATTDPSFQTCPSGFSNPMTTLGDIIYENATPAAARLAGSTSATMAGLTQTGNGTISAAPVWTTYAGGGTSPVAATVTSPAQTQLLIFNSSNVLVNSYSGVNVDQQTGNYTLSCPTDRLGEVEFNISSAATLTLPQAGSTACLGSNIALVVRNASSSTAILTVSPTTSTFQPEGTSSLSLVPGAAVFVYSDATSSTGNYHDIPIATPPGGVNVQTANYTLSLLDKDKLVLMNCSSACTATLPATPPSVKWVTRIASIGSTLAAVSLNSLNFNGGATAPALIRYMPIEVRTDGTNYFGDAPLVAGANVTLTAAANGITVASSGSGSTAFPLTVSGTVNSGGIPYFNSTTQESSSAALTQFGVVFGGGAGGAPTSSAQGGSNFPLIGQGAANPIFSTIAYPTSLTSGGILYGSSATALSSSGLLGASNIVVGGGAGTAPSTDSNASLSAGALTLGASGTLGSIVLGNATSGLLTIEPTTGAITSYTIALPVAQPSGSNTFLSCTAANPAVCTWAAGGGGGSSAFPITVSGTVTSGGIPYFNSTTQESSSALLASGGVVLGGGTGGAPSTSTGLTFSSPTLTVGVAGTTTGVLTLASSTATGSVSLTPASAASAFTLTLPAITDTVATLTATQTLTNKSIALQQITSATGAIATLANGNNPLTINCALTSAVACVTTGETTAATTSGAVEDQVTTLTTSAAIALQLTQGAAGPANGAAPAVINVTAAAAGGAAGASNAGSTGAPITLLTGAGSAGGATTGNGGNGGIFTVTQGVGGAAGGTATNNGGNGGALAWTTGAGGAGGTGAGTAGNGGGVTFTLGAPGANSSTGTAGTVGQFNVTGNAPASTANATGVSAGTTFVVTGVAGGASSNAAGTAGVGSIATINGGVGGAGTGTNAVGGAGGGVNLNAGNGGASLGTGANSNGASITLTPGIAGTGGSGTAGKAGVVSVAGPNAGFVGFTQGSANTTANTNIPANTVFFQAPTSVTAYSVTLPGAAATGFPFWTNASGVVTESIVATIPLNDIVSPTGAVATFALGTNVVTLNCATTSAVNCVTMGETTAATTSGSVETQISTLTTSQAIPLQLTQGAAGPAVANAPAVINVSAAATGGAATASVNGFVGAPITLITGAGSAGGSTTGNGGTGGAFNLTTGAGGAHGGTTTNTGGIGGAINLTTGAGTAGAATGAGAAAGALVFAGGTGGAGGSTSGTGGAGGDFLVTTGTGGAATSGSTTGRGGNFIVTLGSAGGTGTAGAPGQFEVFGGTVGAANVTPFVNVTGTWNTTGTVDAAIFANITNTASGASSLLEDLQVGSASKFSVDKNGLVTAGSISQSGGTQIISGADYTNSTTTPSTVFSWTLPATASAKTYRFSCDIMWESTNTTLVGPVFGVNISAAPTQLTANASVQNTLAGADINGYLSNTTTGSQTLVTSSAAGVTSTNYWAKIWGTIEGAPVAGSTFIINAASTSGTTATLNIRRGSGCTLN